METMKSGDMRNYPVSRDHAEETECPGFGQAADFLI
jgi:hypothetical protein